jgi:major vault protein
MSDTVVRLKPLQYVHIHDNNANGTFVLCGPRTETLPSHQTLLTKDPLPFQVIPRENYAVVENPVARNSRGEIIITATGQARTRIGEKEVRFFQDPFPLYPQEVMSAPQPLKVLTQNQALVLRATRKFINEETGIERNAGDEYLFCGPGVYMPRVDEDVVETRESVVVKFNESLRLRAKNRFVDAAGTTRQVGEEYLYSETGAYMPSVNETLVSVVKAVVVTKQQALHVEVQNTFTDSRPYARCERRAGEVYLVTSDMTTEFTPQPCERIVKEVPLITLTRKQWAVILDPVDASAKPQLGRRKVVTNTQFFLRPGERLESNKIRDVFVLAEDEAVLVVAIEDFVDQEGGVSRISGEQWLLKGPREYIPCESVRIKPEKDGSEKRKRLVLSEGEGVYVRDTLSGTVRAITNCTYMLEADEELWEKELPEIVEHKLAQQLNSHAAYMERANKSAKRDKSKVVKYHVPHNAVTQVFDYKARTKRTIFGPDCVILSPDEQFTVLSLSGSDWDPTKPNVCLPKETDKIKALYLFLGPASMSDVVSVETRDHARLSLQLSYDWRFDVEANNIQQADFCFNVPDFVGDCCSAIASRIRASIASVSFENFHKNSNNLVNVAVFGLNADGQPKKELRFPANRLLVTAVDIQEIEVVDEKTREALRQSVKMAIEITTQGQEAAARQEASVREQHARGLLERQTIKDKASNEVERKRLLEVQTSSAAITSTGQAKAEARARARAADIESDQAVQLAKIKAESNALMDTVQLELRQQKDRLEMELETLRTNMELEHKKAMSSVESAKFGRVMSSIGPDTVAQIAKAGPEMQAKLLAGLGLQGYLVTDGTNPINLFNTANGLAAASATPK